MRTIAFICLVAASALAIPYQNVDFDTAICIFPLVATQNRGGNPSPMLPNILPYMTKEKVLNNEIRMMFLVAGGLTQDQATKMINEVLPVLAREGKSTHEQLMALLMLAESQTDDDAVLPFMTMGSERGCRGKHIHTNVPTTAADECVCNDQDNVLLWISLLDKIQRGADQALNKTQFTDTLPNQIPVVLMVMLAETPCTGMLRGRGNLCKCSVVTEGNEGLLMQLVTEEPNAEQLLNPTAKAKIEEYSREPSARALDLQTLMMTSQMSQGQINPALLPILTGDGTSSEKLMQLLLANRGVDSSLAQLILSGGFKDDANKVSIINYLASKGDFSPDAVPFIMGVDQGSSFFLQSMIHSGKIDPIIGNLLLAQQTGIEQDDIFGLITQLLSGKTTNLKNFGRPFIPALPEGVFPGSKLYFAHMETLGINTCSLHDLRNRFECGFDGISAAQCEVLPYCCYNPIFATDDEVANMTDNAITSATAVPWCYYNVFFIYYNSFALTVKKPGQFASPSSCEPLFKYGLNLDASIYYVFAQSSGGSAISSLVNLRAECGFPGITEFHCVAIRGCCWDKYAPFRVPQCFKSNADSSSSFNLDSIPVAYQPRNHTCSVNYFQFPVLYYRRVACMPTWEMFVKGRDPLKVPDKYECLWELGCCWEENDAVAQKYPESPRCYQREDGTYAVQANTIGSITDLITRSGALDDFPAATQ